jgi:hypothetical protein
MPILVACPGCSTKLNAPDAAAGKRVKCPKPQCGMIVPVPAPAAADPGFEVVEDEPAAPPPKPKTKPLIAAVEVDDDDDRPRKRRRAEVDDDDRPRGRRRDDDDDDDDDDRPRKRRRAEDDDDYDDDRPRRKKRKKSGMGAGAIVAIVLGGIVLLGGVGYGIYALVGGGKAAVPKGWVEYTSDSDKFKGYFPTKPANPRTLPVGLGGMSEVESVTMHMAEPKGEGALIAGVIVVKFKSGISPADRDKAMDTFRSKFSEKENSRISKPRSVRWGGKKAEEISIDEAGANANSKKGGGVMRYFITDTHAYFGIIGTDHAGPPKQEDVDGFFDNFEFL